MYTTATKPSSSSWCVDNWGPLQQLPTMSTFICTLPHLFQLAGVPLPICCIQVCRGRSGDLLQFIPRLCSPFIAMTWHNAWCAGVVASSLTTWPNSAWRLLLIILQCLADRRSCRQCRRSSHGSANSDPVSGVGMTYGRIVICVCRLPVSAPYNWIWRTQVWYSFSLVSRLRPFWRQQRFIDCMAE